MKKMNEKDPDEYEDYPNFEKEEFFVRSVISEAECGEFKQFYDNVLGIITEIGIPYSRKIFSKYVEFYKENKFNQDKTKKVFLKYILNN